MISATEAREAVHVLLLRELQAVEDARAVILKDGVDLRLFHGRPCCSEDLDLDGEADQRTGTRKRRDELRLGIASHLEGVQP